VPAAQADQVKAAGKTIGAAAEGYVEENLLEKWEEVKRQLKVDQVDTEVLEMVNAVDRHMLNIPKQVVHDIISEVHMITFGTLPALDDFNRLLIRARGRAGFVDPRVANELRQELNGRKILDGVVARMSE